LSSPSPELLTIAALLLRAKSNRYVCTGGNSSTYSVVDLVHYFQISPPNSNRNSLNIKTNESNHFGEEDENSPTSFDIKLEICALIEFDPQKHKIYELARERNMKGVKSLLMQGVDVNLYCPNKKYTALIAAVYNKDYNMIELLLQSADIYSLTDCSCIEVWFMDAGGDTPNTSNVPDTSALTYEDKSQKLTSDVKRKKNSIDLDMQGKGSMTALHYASQLGETKIVGRLLSAGIAYQNLSFPSFMN
jgi:ankyrin repeat protein